MRHVAEGLGRRIVDIGSIEPEVPVGLRIQELYPAVTCGALALGLEEPSGKDASKKHPGGESRVSCCNTPAREKTNASDRTNESDYGWTTAAGLVLSRDVEIVDS